MNQPVLAHESQALSHAEEMTLILTALTQLRRGDAKARLPYHGVGAFGKVAEVFNDLVEQSAMMADEVSRLSQVVGKEGKLKKRAALPNAHGFWADSVEHINSLIDDLVHPNTEVARVIGAVAQGDLSKSMALELDGRPLEGEFLRTAKTINKMVEQLGNFSAEVTRVAREVGTEGKLGGQAKVKGVAGTWKDLTDSVNSMAGNLTAQVRNIADVTTAVAKGDLSKKIEVDVKGEFLTLKSTINTMVDQLRSFASEVTRVAREVGSDGILGGQARVEGVSGTWKDLTDSVNFMAGNLTSQVRNIADVTKAVQAGDLSRKITVDVKGEILELKNTINTMVDQLSSFASEVTRVAREVGTEGRLGGQAEVRGVSGVWKDLTDNVNFMAGNLTSQVRGIAKVVTAVANGDLKQKLTVEAKGEIAALAETINSMTDTLATFADQVTTVAREVGVEGKLGGQAKVPGAAGIWKGLTENVNELAANLTTQVRAIADVATAVTQGDLTRSITVETQGEVAALKDTINEMIRNLKDTTQKNTEQDWLKTNLAKFSRMLQGQRDLHAVGQMILSELTPVVGAHQAEFYVLAKSDSDSPKLKLLASYASKGKRAHGKEIDIGEGLVGQCAIEKRKLLLTNVPNDAFRIATGLSESTPLDVLVMPVVFEGEVRGVMELASLEQFNPSHQAFLDQLTESIGIVINTIEANTRTEDLLKQSQSLAEELQQTNQELEEKARQLAHQNQEVERKNTEVEQARQALEEKAKQLALTSKYKSEFLANMSHELRTPLNSLLLLSDQLTRNAEGNLNLRQVEAAKTIHASGNDLLALINDILDLSKIESGTVQVDISELRLLDLQRYVERTFRHIAESSRVGFNIQLDPALPRSMHTDIKRMQQIIKNLLSNAFKFTHEGAVTFSVAPASSGWSPENEELARAGQAIAFSVTDTGIGIPPDKQQIIFEAFQQADGSTSRKYGGTGLGLAISRELAKLLGGEIRLASAPGSGSTFTLYLPQSYHQRGTSWHRRLLGAAEPADQAPADPEPIYAEPEIEPEPNEAQDDRAEVHPDDLSILIVENDLAFARVLLEAARQQGFKGLVAGTAAGALSMIKEYQPSVMTLDIHLPDMQGWRILDRLKADLSTRHIPVCVVSTDDSRERAFNSGAMAFIAKPVASTALIDEAFAQLRSFVKRGHKRLLLLMAPGAERERLAARLSVDDIEVEACESRSEVRRQLRSGQADCLVVQTAIADLQPGDLIEVMEERAVTRQLPIVLYGPEAFGTLAAWKRADGVFALREARSMERLLDTIYFFLHRSILGLPQEQRQAVHDLHNSSRVLEGKKALVVDDDMRNIFAVSTVLHDQGMRMASASNGREAIRMVKEDPEIDIVLMDIMMPEMDGITTMQEIRRLPDKRDLPIIAVTAKAMKGDREKCIRAGAWDYLSKPVDTVHLLAVLRGWLHR